LSPFSGSPSTTGTTPIRDRAGQFQVAESVLTTIATALLEGHTVRLCFSFSNVTSSYRFFVADDVQSSGFPGHGGKIRGRWLRANQPPTGTKTKNTPSRSDRTSKSQPRSDPPNDRKSHSPESLPTNPPSPSSLSYVQVARTLPTTHFPASTSQASDDMSDDETVTTRGSSGLHPDHRQPKLHTQTFKLLFRTDEKLDNATVALRSTYILDAIANITSPTNSNVTIFDQHQAPMLGFDAETLDRFPSLFKVHSLLQTSSTNDNINRGLSSMFNLLCNYPPSDKKLLLPPSCPRQRAILAPTLGQIASKTLYLLDSSSVPSHTTNLQKVSLPR
jgi:hypothetical protein